MVCRGLRALILQLLCLTSGLSACRAQVMLPRTAAIDSVTRPEAAVFLDPAVRQQFSAEWDTVRARQTERGYCLIAVKIPSPSGDSAWYVVRATRVIPLYATPVSISFDCHGLPSLHTHPPTTCATDSIGLVKYPSCVVGGPDGNAGASSDKDLLSVDFDGAPFDIIQYARNSFIVYFPRSRSRDVGRP